MLDVNAKLRTFRKMVWDEERLKSEELFKKSADYNSGLIEEKKARLEEDLAKAVEARRSFATIRKNEQIAKKEEQEKNHFYAHKSELLDDLVGEVKNRLVAYTNTEEYKKNLVDEIAKTLKDLDLDPKAYEILVKDADKDLVAYPHVATLEDRYIGGFIIKSLDGSYQYNKTYLKKINDRNYEIGRTLYNLFERETADESKN